MVPCRRIIDQITLIATRPWTPVGGVSRAKNNARITTNPTPQNSEIVERRDPVREPPGPPKPTETENIERIGDAKTSYQ